MHGHTGHSIRSRLMGIGRICGHAMAGGADIPHVNRESPGSVQLREGFHMSSQHEMPLRVASSSCSRRNFTRNLFAGTVALAAGLGAMRVSAQDTGLVEDSPELTSGKPKVSDVSTTTTSGGQVVVDFALAYLGYPYVYAGNGPGGFDCSGFTQYVILNSLGIDIGHASSGQWGTGAWVDAADLLPGDEVFFAGTYAAGISHTGIYIGDGQFIHAENESTGVTISWLWSDYYGGHYAGANRHW